MFVLKKPKIANSVGMPGMCAICALVAFMGVGIAAEDKEAGGMTPKPFAERFESAASLSAPTVQKRPVEINQHDQKRVDNYTWLRDDNWQDVLRDPTVLDSDIREMLDAENEYYEAVTDDLEDLRGALFEEMRGRIKQDDATVPSADGPWEYWREFREGGEYPIYKRVLRGGGEDVILYDGDKEKGASEFFNIGTVSHSPDHDLIAYSVDRVGSEYFTIRIRNIMSGEELPDIIESAGRRVVWAADSSGFFYVEHDDNQRPKRVKYHVLGRQPADDYLVYEEPDDSYFLGVSKSQSGDYVLLFSDSSTTSEWRYVRADNPTAAPTVIAPRNPGVEYRVEHHDDRFFIITNADNAIDFKIVTAPVSNPGRENWEDWVSHEPGTYILSLIPYKDYIVRMERYNALPRIVVSTLEGEEHEVAFDEQAYNLGLSGGFEFDTDTMRFTYASPSTPTQTIDYNMASRRRTLRKTQEIPSGHDQSLYLVERVFATAPDGEEVPVTILRLKSTPIDGSASVLLYGYGSYGSTIPAGFSTNILPLVDRGIIYALAHPRGGAAKGRQWYLDGKLANKMNTFTDFAAVADMLIARGYTSQKQIVIDGRSAGGLLVGATVNLRPELFAGVIGGVPFVDVINTISDAELPLTPPEWEEWGNPITSAEEFGWIAAYSPYDNIRNTDYPPIMATGGLTDFRVTYWEPAKWVARLREEAKGGPFLLRMNMGAGHGGSAARFERLEETAHLYAFALKVLGKEGAKPIKHKAN